MTTQTTPGVARLTLDGQEHELPVLVGTEGETAVDIQALRGTTGAITLDPGYGNTGSCKSAITFIDGEKGILRYRGYPIEQIAEQADFLEVCWLLLYGELPTQAEVEGFRANLTTHTLLHEDMKKFFEGFPPHGHPMAILASMVTSLSTFYPDMRSDEDVDLNICRLLAKLPTIAAFSYKKSIGQPFIYPRNDLGYCDNFLHMMFAVPSQLYQVNPTRSQHNSHDWVVVTAPAEPTWPLAGPLLRTTSRSWGRPDSPLDGASVP